MSLLFDFKKRLFNRINFNIVGSHKILKHVGLLLAVALVKLVVLWTHIPSDAVDLVSSMGTIFSHDNASFELPINIFLVISFETFINESKTVLDREELRDVVDNKVEPSLVDP